MRRRTLLAGVSALPLAAAGRAYAAPDDGGGFVEACRKLAGTGEFPRFFADAARAILEQEYGGEAVGKLVEAVDAWSGDGELSDRESETMAQRLLTILYTGEIAKEEPKRGDSPYYPWALAWQTLEFARAPGICGGRFGGWSAP
jgi:hypothetical protein